MAFTTGWTIKARVVSKSPIAHYTAKKTGGDGRRQVLIMKDASATIRVTAFMETVERVTNTASVGVVYFFSRGNVKLANTAFADGVCHPCEIIASPESRLVSAGTCLDVPGIVYQFSDIASLVHLAENTFVDVLAAATFIGDIQRFVSRDKPCVTRIVTLKDSTGSVSLTLWNECALDFDVEAHQGQVLAIQGSVK